MPLSFRLFCIALAYISLVSFAAANGPRDWPGYVWFKQKFSYCPNIRNPANGYCLALNVRWDGGRKQFIGYFYQINKNNGKIKILLWLTNKDYLDGDTICFTNIFTDRKGKNIFVFHQRWGVNARDQRLQEFTYAVPPALWKQARTVHMGFRQCQKRDDAAIAKIAITAAELACNAYTGATVACAAAAEALRGTVEKRDTAIGGDD